jgi:hypothetical protein
MSRFSRLFKSRPTSEAIELKPFRPSPRSSLLQLPDNVREMVFDLMVDEDSFNPPPHPPYAHPPYCTPVPQVSTVSYVRTIPTINRQIYEELIRAVCRNPRFTWFVTVRDYSETRHWRERSPHFFRPDPLLFYPGDPVTAETVLPKLPLPKLYLEHVRNLKIFCIVDRSDLALDTYRLRVGGQDFIPSISGALAICDKFPSLQNLEIQVYIAIRDVRGYNYTLPWIDDCLQPLIQLSQNTIVRVMIPVHDSVHAADDPMRRAMLFWRACPGGPEAQDWSHFDHGDRIRDLDGVRQCYRCLRENQEEHRFKRRAEGFTDLPAESTRYETSASRTFDEAIGAEITTINHQANPPLTPQQQQLLILLEQFRRITQNGIQDDAQG